MIYNIYKKQFVLLSAPVSNHLGNVLLYRGAGEAAVASKWTPEATSPTTPSSGCSSSATGPPHNTSNTNSSNNRTDPYPRTNSRPAGPRIWVPSHCHSIWSPCLRCFPSHQIVVETVDISEFCEMLCCIANFGINFYSLIVYISFCMYHKESAACNYFN